MVLLIGFMAVVLWAKKRDPFERVEFTLRTASGGKVKGLAILPKPVAEHPVVIYLHGAGGSLLDTGTGLRQVAELGLAAVGLEYCQTNQAVFDEEFIALHRFLRAQPWALSNATAWVGYSQCAQRTLSFALRHPEFQPQLLVRRAGGWVSELGNNDHPTSNNPQTEPPTPALSALSGDTSSGFATFSPSDAEKGIEGETVSGRTEERPRNSTFNSQPSTLLKCPVLLVHGGGDEVFPVADCQRLAERLRAGGTLVDVRMFPELGHSFGEESEAIMRGIAEYCAARLPLTDYSVAVDGCRLTGVETERFNVAMRRAGQHRRELWQAVSSSQEPERHTVMNMIGGLEDYDLAHVTSGQLREFVGRAWEARRTYPWCRDAPLEIFERFVANPRIYEEPLPKRSFPFLRHSLPRVKYCRNGGEASDAVGAWLYSRLRLRTAPPRPESSMDEMIRQSGACREGAMMYTYLGRKVGLPMRPVYVIWPTLGSWHWYTEVWDTGEKQWHAVDSANPDRTYHTSWVLRVRKSTILSTTGERGGWNALNEQRWEAFTNTVGLFYPSGQVVVRVLDGEEPAKGQRVVAQAWLSNEVFSVLAARTDGNGEARLTLGQTARHPYRVLVDGPGETDWQWLTVQSNQTHTVTLRLDQRRPFDKRVEPPVPQFPNREPDK
ncbi:MAG: dienelactone hydrolase family protein [Verrucomicrobia bacterium]|nr:dienelactone hydrolase family protein [Verrucomicrobiota bacterium]